MKYPYGKRILITGASSGIGKAAAALFARQGYTVFAASRHCESTATPVGTGRIVSIPMDVCDEKSVETAVKTVLQSGPLGIVLHSAGMGIAGAAEDTPDAAIRTQFDVNYFGVLRVNRHVLPAMREQQRGLVILMSSVAGRIPIPFQSHYSSSKYALDAYAEALRMELHAFGIQVCLVEPGDTKTGFTKNRQNASPALSPYAQSCESAVARMAKDEQNGAPPEKPAKVALRLAQRKRPPVRKTVGFQYKVIMLLRRLLPAGLFESALRSIYK